MPIWQRWALVYVALSALDVLTTAVGLRLGIVEGNPYMAGWLRASGELGMYGVKVALVAFVVLLGPVLARRYRRFGGHHIYVLGAALAAFAVANNLYWIVSQA